jgi:O-antigen ligase
MKINNIFLRENLKKFSISDCLFIFLPVLLVSTGSFLSNVAVSAISIIFLIKLLFKKINICCKKYFLFSMLFLLILITSSLFSDNIYPSIEKSFSYLRFLILPIAVSYLIEKNPLLSKYFYKSLLITFIILTLDGIFQFFIGENTLGFILHHIFNEKNHAYRLLMDYKVQGMFADEGIIGSYLSRLLPVLIGLSIFFNKYNNRLFYFIYILSAIVILLSGERAAMVLFLITHILLIIFVKNIRQIIIKLSFFVFLFCGLFVLLNTNIYNRFISKTIDEVTVSKNKNIKFFILSKYHEPLILTSINMFKNNLFTGIGTRNFRNACKQDENFVYDSNLNLSKAHCNNHPHNYYFQILSETGILGFSFSIFCILYFAITLLKLKIQIPDYIRCMIIALFLSLFPFISTGSFFNSWLSCIHFIPIIFILNFFNKINKKCI